jgi:hypothetical protein
LKGEEMKKIFILLALLFCCGCQGIGQATVDIREAFGLPTGKLTKAKIQEQKLLVINNAAAMLANIPPDEQQNIIASFKRIGLSDEEIEAAKAVATQIQTSSNLPILKIQTSGNSFSFKLNAYGQGVHMNQYGQPVILKPDFGGVPGEQLQIKTNAYGLGVHMDQYGRPVREYPWP